MMLIFDKEKNYFEAACIKHTFSQSGFGNLVLTNPRYPIRILAMQEFVLFFLI